MINYAGCYKQKYTLEVILIRQNISPYVFDIGKQDL